MSRIKSIFAVLVLTAMVGVVPQAHAQNFKVVLSGSSALWQTLALGAYNNGTSIVSGGGQTFHWTSASNAVGLIDTRVTPVNNDPGTIWVVWDSAATPNVWVFDKVDSVVGDRCYFAAPKCTVAAPASVFSAAGASQISSALWGADSNLPANVQSVLTNGIFVNSAATDIRPEDAAFAACRVNSALGASAQGGSASDGLDGLGYNSNNASGVCPVWAAGTAQSKGLGNPILSGFPGSTSQANVLAFNLTGKDPITNTKLPAAFTVTAVGAAPIVFITERDKGPLTHVTNATEQQLQAAFSGANCNASAFGSDFSGAISIYLREPLSGTYNTAEATVFRYPTIYPDKVVGVSQETGVGSNNPLKGQAGTCSGGGKRFRAIGTGEEVNSVKGSGANNGTDGIGYTFFSYGNVSGIANNTAYGYIQLNGVDPIFASYGTAQTIDPGQPSGAGVLPAQANLPSSCNNSFPCPENEIWGNGFSFPNLRNGTYRSWSLLRIVATGAANTNAVALAKASNQFVVTSVPDYVPAKPVTGIPGITELGLKLVRSHYQQEDGSGVKLGKAATNVPENGGDMGGMIIPTTIGVTTEKQAQIVQGSSADGSLSPAKRPVL
jgi:hypothetical protein